MKISIIVPCYDARGKIESCVSSLRAIDFPARDFEVIFVDDCSSDGTYAYLHEVCEDEPSWSVYRFEENSGSPSKPRNFGTQKACGQYILYLDCDDTLFPDTLRTHYDHAVAKNACIVRGYLIVDDGNTLSRALNRIPNWKEDSGTAEKIASIITSQSTTVVSLIKRNIIVDNGIMWCEDIRLGEDTLFLIDVLVNSESIHYIDHPTFTYNKRLSRKASSTQQYGRRELKNHLRVWTEAERKLNEVGISYYEIRLHVGLATAFKALVFHGSGDVDEVTFREFCDFLEPISEHLNKKRFDQHYLEILDSVSSHDYAGFVEACKPRLLIAGYDLKFILPSVQSLGAHFNIRIDEWKGHEEHDEKQSRQLLQWAEYIWCEWLLGNAVWYSRNKRWNQKLIIRMHRMELQRNYGEELNVDAVNSIVTVSVLFFERLLQKFANIPRDKVRLVPNYASCGIKDTHPVPERLFRLGAVGIVPSRKGFLRMLRILASLREKDARYSLDVFGHGPENFSWITRDRAEMQYYEECNDFIRRHDLSDCLNMVGFAKMPEALSERKIGFVLSTSMSGEFPESFHLAVLDGFSGGGQSLVLRWDGCEYIYPSSIVFDNEEEIVEYISNITIEKFYQDSEIGRDLITSRYNEEHFISSVVSIFKE